MNSLRAVTRRAALAAFLLFAAALLVVGPAEASRTTDPHSSLTPLSAPSLASSSTHELASLELSLLEPLAPDESSPRFGFVEDLSLIDVEARPCGFELFGGVETSRCALAYARNNPVNFIDPTGLMTENGRVVAEAEVVARDPGEAQRLNGIRSMQLALQLRALLMRAERNAAAQPRSPSVLPHGIGLVAGGGGEAGMGPRALGLAGQAYSGGGVFWGDGLNAGGFTQSGGFGGQTNPEQFAFLGSAGVGVGAFTTNATYPKQLLGPFDTWQLTLPIYTLQYSHASPIWFFGVTRAAGKSFGFSFSRYPVTTTSASGRAGQ